ncbi:G protein-regulated inducer of neurite outgrowth 3 [Rhinophrynus dorsalis]
MGTVPDPQGSSKVSLITTAMEEDCPKSVALHVANHQHKQATSDKSCSGISISETGTSDPNCSSSMKGSDCEKICEHESQESSIALCSLRTSNQSDMLPLSDVEHLTMREPQGIKDCGQYISTANNILLNSEINTVSSNVAQLTLPRETPSKEENITDGTMIKMTASEKVDQWVHANRKELYESPPETDFEKLNHSKEGNMSVPSQGEECDNRELEKNQNTGHLISGPKIQDELKTNFLSSSEECSQLCLEETEINKDGGVETLELQLQCKFKEMGTMTSYSHLESWTKQDAEVQAVANVENKSVSTSPSILAAFLKANSPGLKERQEQVCIIYQGNPAATQLDRANFALQSQLSQNHLKPKLCFQPPDSLSSQSLQLHRQSPPDLARSAFQHSEIGRNSQLLYRNELEAQAMCLRESHAMSQMPMASSSPILMNVKPVYQINIENSNQPKARSMDKFNEPSQFRTAHDVSNKSRIHHLSGVENIQLHNVRADNDQIDTLSIPGDVSSDRKPFHFKITNEQGSTQAIITTDIKKPKKEDRPTPLHVEVEVNSTLGATGGQVEEILEVLIKKEQDENEHAKRASSLSLHSRSSSDFNQNAGLLTPRLRKTREEKNEPVLVTLSTSEQSKSHGKKTTPQSSSTEAENQEKQSKSVKDVVWDEQGMTWEVYGASMDPESLGIAIQNHLQRQIREHEKMIRAQLKQNRKSICSDTSGKKHKRRQHRVFQSILKNIRRPNCCARPPPTSVLE